MGDSGAAVKQRETRGSLSSAVRNEGAPKAGARYIVPGIRAMRSSRATSAARLRRFGGRRGVRTRVRSEGGSRRGRGRFRRTRRAALHDVLDLIAVERFQLEQR